MAAPTPDPTEVLKQVNVAPADKMVFKGTFEDETKQELVITNPTDSIITFKLKGTSPDIIKQRPGYGYINPKDKAVITVFIASLKNRKKLPGKQRITAMLAVPPAEKPANAFDLWKNEAVAKSARRQPINLKFKRKKGKSSKKEKGGKEDASATEEESEEGPPESEESDASEK